MVNRPKVKGTRWESAVAGYLCQFFPACERRALSGAGDRGDLLGLPATIECKATRQIDLAGALGEARAAAARNGDEIYAAVIKRRSHATSQAYAVMPLSVFAALLARWEGT